MYRTWPILGCSSSVIVQNIVSILLLTRATLTSAAGIPTVSTINLNGLNFPTTNATSLGAIDPRFNVSPQYSATDLDEDQLLMNVAENLARFSVENFTDPIIPEIQVYREYPGVVIIPYAATPGGTIEPRFLVWGLYKGIKPMIQNQFFKSVNFTLEWNDQVVGLIEIKKPTATINVAGNSDTESEMTITPNIIKHPSNNTYTTTTIFTTPDNIPHRLKVHLLHLGPPLPKYTVFMAILNAFPYLAVFRENQRLAGPFRLTPPLPFDATLGVEEVLPEPPFPRTFTYGWAARSMPGLLAQLVFLKRWCEVDFVSELDGKDVGLGEVVAGRGGGSEM